MSSPILKLCNTAHPFGVKWNALCPAPSNCANKWLITSQCSRLMCGVWHNGGMVKRFLDRARHLHRTSIEHERLTSLINSMADGVIAVNSNMKIVTSNG